MPKLKVLSGADVVKILETFDFVQVSQKSSHIKMRGVTQEGGKQTLTIPNHKELGVGTVRGIFNQSSRFISREELAAYFYTK